jgi:hypothetical protein
VSRLRRSAGLLALLLALTLTLPHPAGAAPTRDDAVLATKAALDAFFAMPAAQPEGAERGDAPEGFDGEQADQAALIAFLQDQQAQGARWDRYRWGGTLLHHSLRIPFNTVAQWLLDHGADPLQQLDPATNPDQLDALGIAVRLQRWGWVTTLLKHPAYQKLSPAERGRRLWAGAASEAQVAALLRLRPAVPLPAPDSPAGQQLMLTALCGHQLGLLERLTASGKPRLPAPLVSCSAELLPKQPVLDLPAWLALEARFDAPLLPWLLPALHTTAELQTVLGAGLRQPWAQTEFSRRVLFSTPPELLAPLLLRAQPGTAVLWAGFERRQGQLLLARPLSEWQAVVRSAPELQTLLDTLEQATQLRTQARANEPGASADWTQRWAALVQRVDALGPAQRRQLKLPSGLLRQLPPAFLANALAWAREADALPELLPGWLVGSTLAELQAGWPLVKASSPALASELLAAALTPLLAEPPAGRLAKAVQAQSVANDDLLPKARWLRAQGLAVPARPLAVALRPRAGGEGPCCSQTLVAWALQEKLVTAPPPEATLPSAAATTTATNQRATPPTPAGPHPTLRLISTAPACKPQASTALRRALAQPTTPDERDDGGRGFDEATLQPLAEPGRAECRWLRSEIAYVGANSWTEVDFFTGVSRFTPCGDGETRLAVWDEVAARFVVVSREALIGHLVEAELLPRGGPLWLSTEVDSGRCGRGPGSAQLLSWQQGLPKFEPMPDSDPRQGLWQTACAPDQLGACLGLDTAENGTPPPPPPPRAPILQTLFVEQHWARERADFLAAFDRLERPRLDTHQRDGLFAPWVNDAVKALTAGARPLPERRARMAWLLAQPQRAAALTDDTVQGLLPWLPAEDWRPLIEARRCAGWGGRWSLRQWAEKAPAALARRLAVGLATDCKGVVQ